MTDCLVKAERTQHEGLSDEREARKAEINLFSRNLELSVGPPVHNFFVLNISRVKRFLHFTVNN